MSRSSSLVLLLALSLTGCDCGRARIVGLFDAGCLAAEVCGNGVDDTCDGTVDEGCECTAGESRVCGTDVGVCVIGQQQCSADWKWEACLGGVVATEETCDGADNDCDGATDEDDACRGPTVVCPPALTVEVGKPHALTATATQSTDRPIASQAWTVVTRPATASAEPAPATAAATQLVADVEGAWRLSFCATDTAGLMGCCETDVTASVRCALPPSPPVSTACATSWDGRPIVQFAAVPAGLVYELSQGTATLGAATEGQNHIRPASRIAPGAPVPGASVALQVRACRAGDATCCSDATTTTVNVVAACTTPVAPTAANIVLSEYVVNGEGSCPSPNCATMDTCQAGEAIEITNLSACPVALDGFHFAYRNSNASAASARWMNFGPTDIIPPRGVYVAIRNRQYAPTCAAPLGTPSAGLYGLNLSPLAMEGLNLCNGWFNNTGGGQSELRVAPGVVTATPTFTPGAAIARIAPYLSGGSSTTCASTGFDAVDSCGAVVSGAEPTARLSPNQLGRLWHPCDNVSTASPACVRD